MGKKTVAGPEIAKIAVKVVDLLEPLGSEDRQRAINGALTLLGETRLPGPRLLDHSGSVLGAGGESHKSEQRNGLHQKAAAWMKQHGLTIAQIEQAFDLSDQGVAIIASEAPGKNGKQKTLNTYVLYGVSRLLSSGDTAFNDKDARKACDELGCYDSANHALYMKDKGKLLTGSKDGGWKLTAPGLKHGADLIKELSKGS